MDYNHLPRGRRKTAVSWRLLLLGFIFLAIFAGGFMFYEYKTHPQWSVKLAVYRERVTLWLAERKKNMHHGIAKVRNEPDERDDGERAVNFEFYSTLQDMKSMEVDAHAAAQQKMAEAQPVKTASANTNDDAAKNAKKSRQLAISHAADIENDLLAAMKKNAGEN